MHNKIIFHKIINYNILLRAIFPTSISIIPSYFVQIYPLHFTSDIFYISAHYIARIFYISSECINIHRLFMII